MPTTAEPGLNSRSTSRMYSRRSWLSLALRIERLKMADSSGGTSNGGRADLQFRIVPPLRVGLPRVRAPPAHGPEDRRAVLGVRADVDREEVARVAVGEDVAHQDGFLVRGQRVPRRLAAGIVDDEPRLVVAAAREHAADAAAAFEVGAGRPGERGFRLDVRARVLERGAAAEGAVQVAVLERPGFVRLISSQHPLPVGQRFRQQEAFGRQGDLFEGSADPRRQVQALEDLDRRLIAGQVDEVLEVRDEGIFDMACTVDVHRFEGLDRVEVRGKGFREVEPAGGIVDGEHIGFREDEVEGDPGEEVFADPRRVGRGGDALRGGGADLQRVFIVVLFEFGHVLPAHEPAAHGDPGTARDRDPGADGRSEAEHEVELDAGIPPDSFMWLMLLQTVVPSSM
ncbi:MAG: hypothetical protein KatS3mg043_2215 [Rhodothermaceae bacterium]|nr:MAG: hypothetical protein KatS3mg043_2215 [Rhodothermaceae bacterium]